MDDFENNSKGFFRKNAIWLAILVALVVFGFLLFKDWDKIVNNEIDGMITITGNFSCLPLKVGVAVTEDVCTLGIKSRDGENYALDISRIQDANTDLKVKDTIAVTGTFESKDKLLAPEWVNYEIANVILVNTLLRTK